MRTDDTTQDSEETATAEPGKLAYRINYFAIFDTVYQICSKFISGIENAKFLSPA